MKKRCIALLTSLVLVLTMLSGCSSSNEGESVQTSAGGELNWNMGIDPKTWDPQLDDSAASTVIGNIFEGLMRDNMDGTIEPGQAAEYTISEDGLKYTFKLRDDIFWSDGKPVTANDFEYAWKRLCDPNVGSPYGYMALSYIKNADEFFHGEASYEDVGVKAVDEKTLEVELVSQVPYFLDLTAFFCFMPVRQDIVEEYGEGWEKNPETCIVNGPFKISEYQIGSHITYVKNDKYYDADNVHIDKINGSIILEASTALNAFENGDLDVNQVIPTAELPRLISEEPNLIISSKLATEYMIYNVDQAPVNDPKVRKALTLAIDRKTICEAVLKGGQLPAVGLLPPVLSYSDGTPCRNLDEYGMPTPEYGILPDAANIEEAQRLLAEAGYPNGEGFPTLDLSYATSESRQKVAEAIQEMWKMNLNINVNLVNKEWQVLVDERKNGDFIISIGNWVGDYPDPMTFYDAFALNSGWNEAQWRWKESQVAPNDTTFNPEHEDFEKAVTKAQHSMGAERDAALKEAENIIMENMIIGPIYHSNYCYLVNQARVTNVWRNKVGELKFRNVEVIG